MYYEESIIDGVLCWRTDPHGEWKKMDYAELLRNYQDTQRRYSEQCRATQEEQGIARLWQSQFERLQSAERWHKYPDEKPEEKEKIYLVYFSRTGNIMRAMWDYQGCQQFCEVDDGEYYGKEMQGITHWRPLPQPPSESQVGGFIPEGSPMNSWEG